MAVAVRTRRSSVQEYHQMGLARILKDWPHWDNEFPENIHEMEKRQDLSEEIKRAILSGTARRLYGLDG